MDSYTPGYMLIIFKVEFDKKCDSIDECTSDLKLTVDMFLLKRDGTSMKVEEDTVIYIGDANELEVGGMKLTVVVFS